MRPILVKAARAFSALLLALVCILFVIRVRHGIGFLGFVDETEHLLGGKMLNAGMRLYRDFVTQHGPVTFMLTQAYGALFGWSRVNDARWMSALLAVGATAAVITSAPLARTPARFWAAALFLGMTTSAWLVQALYMVNYHTIGGMLAAVSLALCIIPLWLGAGAGPARAAAAYGCLIFMAGTAYSFGPAALLLGTSGMSAAWRAGDRRAIWSGLSGAAIALLCLLAWLLMFGSISGYLAFHFAENQFVFAKLSGVSLHFFVVSQLPSLYAEARVHTMGLVCWAGGTLLLLHLNMRRQRPSPSMALPILLGAAGLISICARGGTGFQDGCFLLGSFALFAIAFAASLQRGLKMRSPAAVPWAAAGGTALVGLCIVAAELNSRHAYYSPFHIKRSKALAVGSQFFNIGKNNDPISLRIRAATGPGDRILAVPYAPNIYLAADRAPMRRYFYYLPWDAAYAKAPFFGQDHDLCADLPKRPPAVIYYDDWTVWGRWNMHQYLPCFFEYLKAEYTQDPKLPFLFIRNKVK